ncbi:phosphate system positive regulatory protein pho81 [Blastocladiella emersonii ATCC 22665]|nr:phosphate system positive regulatory protein pho81 [Blastocladiella emersonii ATCC 22665]
MKFGKQIQGQATPEWSAHYMNYKALKKVINVLEDPRKGHAITIAAQPVSPSLAAASASGTSALSPADYALASAAADPMQALKANFFFKLERELERVNAFYMTKENDLGIRLRTLLEKKRFVHEGSRNPVTLRTIQEALWQLQQDLTKLQQYVELNATGFRKILKKWDKRSKSSTKELYLSRQIEVQPCFNRDTLTELTDLVAVQLAELNHMDLAAVASPAANPTRHAHSALPGASTSSAAASHGQGVLPRTDSLEDLESELIMAAKAAQPDRLADMLGKVTRNPTSTALVSRVLQRACKTGHAPTVSAVLASTLPDVAYCDEINERTCLHTAVLSGSVDAVRVCIEYGASLDAADVYGRTPLHYAALNAAVAMATLFLELGARSHVVDHDGCTPLIYAIIAGNTELVGLLLTHGSRIDTQPHHLLSLAAQYGHVEIATLLIAEGAPLAPEEGLHPLHIAAKQGHLDLTRLLCQHVTPSVDISDKYYNWTPLFYAAAEGHMDCARALLDTGARADLLDESNWTCLAHALYRGHIDVAALLVAWLEQAAEGERQRQLAEAAAAAAVAAVAPMTPSLLGSAGPSPLRHQHTTPSPLPIQPIAPSRLFTATSGSPGSNPAAGADHDGPTDMDLDTIPSLALPPPILPFRIYGHMYLEAKYQVQLGFPSASPVTLYAQNLASLRLVIAAKPDTGGTIPHTVILPMDDEHEVYAFQAPDLGKFALHVDVFPTYGTKPIARGAVLAHDLVAAVSRGNASGRLSVPLFDAMALVGELAIDFSLISPFSHPKLSVGGAIATYWKTTQVVPAMASATSTSSSRLLNSSASATGSTGLSATAPGSVSSLMASPVLPSGVASAAGGTGSGHHGGLASLITASSLAHKYVHVPVQVTRDGVPVVYPDAAVPVHGDLVRVPVAHLTAAQFAALAQSAGTAWDPAALGLHPSATRLAAALRGSFLTLGECLARLPRDVALVIELKYTDNGAAAMGVNPFVDRVLATVYDDAAAGRPRSLVFCSFHRHVCNAVNWKQPNFAVFFNTYAGYPPRDVDAADDGGHDGDASLKDAIRFAKANNMLGVLCFARPMVQVPLLVQAVKESGLLLATFGEENAVPANVLAQERAGVDGVFADGVLRFTSSAAAGM